MRYGTEDIRRVFNTPYEQYSERKGQPFVILGEEDPKTYDFEEVGPMYRIQFPDGEEITAWPEEVFEIPWL